MDGKEKVFEAADKLARQLEKMRINEYTELMHKPGRILYLNFLAGMARGLGMAVGATIVFAILLDILRRLIVLNLPVIGNFIADIMKIIEVKQG